MQMGMEEELKLALGREIEARGKTFHTQMIMENIKTLNPKDSGVRIVLRKARLIAETEDGRFINHDDLQVSDDAFELLLKSNDVLCGFVDVLGDRKFVAGAMDVRIFTTVRGWEVMRFKWAFIYAVALQDPMYG
jgi:hypothetical protein